MPTTFAPSIRQRDGNGAARALWFAVQEARPCTPKKRSTMRRNKLNDLTSKEWLKFQKSWFVHNPPPREKDVLLHPAKFPEDMVQQFIEFFTKRGETVLDPMVGTGSTLVAAYRAGRRGYGIELQPKYAEIARKRLADLSAQQVLAPTEGWAPLPQTVITADARDVDRLDIPTVDYCMTSPPYWDMLRRKGFETQKTRKELGLDVHYSDDSRDVGNLADYQQFLEELVEIYAKVVGKLRPGGYITIVVKNVKKGGRLFPLAWDLGRRLGEFLELKDERIWCQDNQRLAPYGMGSAWVSNTMHHYCLNFRKPRR
jgi:DNA modification methylase